MYLFLVDDNSGHKTAKDMNKSVATTNCNEYKDLLWNQNCLIHSMNKIQSKNHAVETYEINKSFLTCFDDKVHVLNNRYGGLSLCY